MRVMIWSPNKTAYISAQSHCWNHGKVPHKAVIHIGPGDVLPRLIIKQRTSPGIKDVSGSPAHLLTK